MNAFEKACWWELAVVVITLSLVTILFPWWGNASMAAFGLLGLLAVAAYFVRRRGDRVVVDERDQEIGKITIHLGVHVAWMFLFTGIILLVVTDPGGGAVSKSVLSWMIWIQFALCYLVKSVAGVYLSRKDRHAT